MVVWLGILPIWLPFAKPTFGNGNISQPQPQQTEGLPHQLQYLRIIFKFSIYNYYLHKTQKFIPGQNNK